MWYRLLEKSWVQYGLRLLLLGTQVKPFKSLPDFQVSAVLVLTAQIEAELNGGQPLMVWTPGLVSWCPLSS